MIYRLTLPYYYTIERKTKKNKTVMVGMNYYRNAHYQILNNIKKHYHKLVTSRLEAFEGDRLGKYRIKYKMYYKRNNQDLMNVVSIIDKFVQDSLQEFGLVENDNVCNCVRIVAEAIEQDKINPRIEIEIEGAE